MANDPEVVSTATAEPTDLLADPSTTQVEAVAAVLDTDVERGLTSDEAARRLAEAGPNELDAAEKVPTWRKLLAQLHDPLIYLLLVAVLISLVVWALEGATGAPVDAIVIVVIVIANAVLGYVQEARAEEAVAALQGMAAAKATVVRDGQQVEVAAREVVPGDVLLLEGGDAVSADGRLASAAGLRIAEASLTGESEAVLKEVETLPEPAALGDRLNMAFSGTAVVEGTGRMVVTATGMASQMGHIAELLSSTEQEDTPLEREISRVGRFLGIAVVVIAVVVMGAVLVTSDVRSAEDLVTVLLLGVSLAVAAVPEGLPAILSVVLALGVQRMAGQHAIVKNLSSVETLGSATVVCSDKTGTLTRSEMMIERVVTPSGEVSLTGEGYDPEGRVLVTTEESTGAVTAGEELADGPLLEEVALVLGGGSLVNDAVLRQVDGAWTIQGDPTEAAFLVAERKLGTLGEREGRFVRVGDVPFTSERKLMTTVAEDTAQTDTFEVVTKGAPDVLLNRCRAIRVAGEVVPLEEHHRARILADVERLSEQAYRTLGVAYKPVSASDHVAADESIEHGLAWLGLVGIIDPPREEAGDAIVEAARAGVRTIMITGDHPATAARIADDLGITTAGRRAVTGLELDALDDDEFDQVVREVSVYARVAPEHKLRIVDSLQADGHVVAMTGDGVNDAPALKSADIGVAMGITGTDVTKEAAKMVLADDNFATIVAAIREGRGIFTNIKKFLRYLLSSNMGEVLTLFFGVVLAGLLGLTAQGESVVVPLLAVQILWINLLTDTGPALAMGVDPPMEDVMDRPPRTPGERVIDGRMSAGVVYIGAVMALVTLFAIDLYLPGGIVGGGEDLDTARTVGFTVLVLAQLFNALNARSEHVSALHHLLVNPWLWAALALSLVLQVAVVHVPLLNTAFGTTPLDAGQWAVAFGLSAVVLVAGELRKLVLRARVAR